MNEVQLFIFCFCIIPIKIQNLGQESLVLSFDLGVFPGEKRWGAWLASPSQAAPKSGMVELC